MDTKYDTTNLTPDQSIKTLRRAKALCRNWWVDVLDCRKSWRRQLIEMPFDEVMGKYDGTPITVIVRRPPFGNHLEVGFRCGRDPEFFLWIILDTQHAVGLTKGLKEL